MKNKLQKIIKNEKGTIRYEVAQDCLNDTEDSYSIKDWFNDLLSHGCQSGMIGHLIYYDDTHKFYDKYYDEIEEIRQELEDSLGQALNPEGDLKNWYAWLGYEETARKIAEELGLEV